MCGTLRCMCGTLQCMCGTLQCMCGALQCMCGALQCMCGTLQCMCGTLQCTVCVVHSRSNGQLDSAPRQSLIGMVIWFCRKFQHILYSICSISNVIM